MTGTNGWEEYKRLVLASQERLEDQVEEIQDTLTEMRLDIRSLQVRASIWGIIAGFVASGLVSLALKLFS